VMRVSGSGDGLSCWPVRYKNRELRVNFGMGFCDTAVGCART